MAEAVSQNTLRYEITSAIVKALRLQAMTNQDQSQPVSPRAYQFDPIDAELFWARARLTPGERIQAMLDARELLVGLIRGRLSRLYPDLSPRELNLKVLEEIERVKSIRPRP